MRGDFDLISCICFVVIYGAVFMLIIISFNDDAAMAFNEGLYVADSFFSELCSD